MENLDLFSFIFSLFILVYVLWVAQKTNKETEEFLKARAAFNGGQNEQESNKVAGKQEPASSSFISHLLLFLKRFW